MVVPGWEPSRKLSQATRPGINVWAHFGGYIGFIQGLFREYIRFRELTVRMDNEMKKGGKLNGSWVAMGARRDVTSGCGVTTNMIPGSSIHNSG